MAVGSLYPGKLGCCQIERPLPGHGQEPFATPPLSIAMAAREPALTYHRLVDERRRMHGCRNRCNQRRRIGIAFKRSDTNDPAILHLGEKRTPMRMVANDLAGHGCRLSKSSSVDGLSQRGPEDQGILLTSDLLGSLQ